MKKVADVDVIAKFAEVIASCPDPEAAKELNAALQDFLEGNTEEADRKVTARTVAERKKDKRMSVWPNKKDPNHIDHNLVEDNDWYTLDNKGREFD